MTTKHKILLVEDDLSLIDGLQYTLEKNGFAVDVARTAAAAHSLAANPHDLLLLDVTLPDGTGYEICESLRRRGDNTPIIFLTAADEEINIIRGLDCGGDDYITKPFRLGELLARIHALLRRAQSINTSANSLTCGDIIIDFPAGKITLGGNPLELTNAEYRLLCLLVRNANQVVTRQLILDELWDGQGSFVDDNTLSVYIRRLREKVEQDPSHPKRLVTVRGFGYQWNEVSK